MNPPPEEPPHPAPGNASLPLKASDQLLQMYAIQFARNRATERFLCRVVAAVEIKDIDVILAEFKRVSDGEYERLMLDVGEEHPTATEFLDVRSPEERDRSGS